MTLGEFGSQCGLVRVVVTKPHWEILETLANPYGVLGRAVLEQMKLVPA